MIEFKLPKEAEFVINRLEENGFEAFAVGGCVRDRLMNREPNDYDVTTSALPDEMEKVFSDCRVVETGLKHGTLTIVFDEMSIEATTYRIDGEYADSRHPKQVTFTSNLSEDLKRRDFTVNAIAYSPEKGFVDLFEGQDDIEKKIIRCVGVAEDRFTEDALRILRAVRFSSQLDFRIEEKTSDAVYSMYHTLEKISRERIYQEMTKLVTGKAAGRILCDYCEVIAFALDSTGENITPDDIKRASDIIDSCPKNPEARYGAILSFCDDIKKSEIVYRNLKPSRKSLNETLTYIKELNSDTKDEYTIKSITGKNDETFVLNLMGIQKAMGINEMDDKDTYNYAVSEYKSLMETSPVCRVSELKVGGDDMIEIGLKGIQIKEALNYLLEMVMKNTIENDRDKLIQSAKKFSEQK